MSTEIIEAGKPPQKQSVSLMDYALTPDRVTQQIDMIGKLMQSAMRPDVHYGVIPGTKKPSLFLAGAEFLGLLFRIEGEMETTWTDLGGGHREYKTTCVGIHIPTGTRLGNGTGICSTMESKYRWRNAEKKCPSCGKEAIIKGKAEYGGGWLCYKNKGGCGSKYKDGDPTIEQQIVGKVENADPADQWHTCSMMSQKRSYVAMIRRVTGASTFVTQDLEDMFGGLEGEVDQSAFGGAYENQPFASRSGDGDHNSTATTTKQASKSNDNASSKTEPGSQQETSQGQYQRRSRRNTIELDGKQYNTCGVTADQIKQIQSFTRAAAENKTEVQKWITVKIGYNEPSYLREDEAAELITFIQGKSNDSGGGGGDRPKEQPTESTGPGPQKDMPDDLVTCPLNGDRMSKSQHCLTSCRDRQNGGFCPAVDTDNAETLF